MPEAGDTGLGLRSSFGRVLAQNLWGWQDLGHLPMAWYRGLIVVGWWRTRISASNSQEAWGFRRGETITMPFRMDERFI